LLPDPQLRDEGRSVDLPADLRQRLAEREMARIGHVTAERAASRLGEERSAARAEAEARARSARLAAIAVIARKAERMVERHAELLAEASALCTSLLGFDRLTAVSGATLAPRVASLLRESGMNLAARVDTAAWQAALAALLGDPQAVVEME
jgi:hypothetical protein